MDPENIAVSSATKVPDLPELTSKWRRRTVNQETRKHWVGEALVPVGTYSKLAGKTLLGECYVTQRK